MVRAAFGAAALFLAGGVVPMVGGVALLFAPTPVLGYAVGLLASLWLDLPSGPMIVCAMVAAGLLVALVGRRFSAS